MLNYEVFAKNPLNYHLPNDGVASGTEPRKDEEWLVLRQELQNFICDGEYRNGIERILQSFLDSFDNATTGTQQKAVWISGFYGSGKSHFVRVLKFLWANKTMPDGAEPRSLVPSLPIEVRDLFKELNTRAKPSGGLWSAIGTLGKGAKDSPRLAFLAIVFAAADLPSSYAAAKFVLWLRRNGYEESVKSTVIASGRDWTKELFELYASPILAEAVLAAFPGFAETPAKAREMFRAEFPKVNDITDDALVDTMAEVLGGQSTVPGQIPLSLLVIDELQQYIGDDTARTLEVQEVIETCCKRFGGRLMVVATGQSAMGGTDQLKKLQGRFTLRVQLSDADSLRVVREVVLRKQEEKKAEVQQVLDNRAGEIDRHLSGSQLAADATDRPDLVADYPILPTRRRFWERALRSVDRSGGAAQLRTQLKAVHEAVRAYAERPVGHVVGADVLFDQLRQEMLQSGALQNDTDNTIGLHEREETLEAALQARILKVTFFINQLDESFGVRATPEVLGDLLVENLATATTLRQQIPAALAALTHSGQLLEVGGQYRIQTRESAAWTADYRAAESKFKGEQGRLASDRATELKNAFAKTVGKGVLNHGACKQPRDLLFHFGESAPETGTGIPVWVRDGWNTTEKKAREDAVALGMNSPVVHVFLPSRETDALKDALASFAATEEVLIRRGHPSTREGEDARAGMQSHSANARRRIDELIGLVLRDSSVFLSGGGEVLAEGLRNAILSAAEKALIRLYPRFSEGDHARWGDVVKQLREGGSDAFKKVDYDGEPDKHPVCAAVLTFVGAGRKGGEVRKHFNASPYGWPPDAIDSALLVLTSTQHLSATRNGIAVPATKISGAEIGQTEFKREHITLNLSQKVSLKAALASMGFNVVGDDLAGACQQLVSGLESLLARAGGPAPAPAPQVPAFLDELKTTSGNALALSTWEKRDEITALWQERTATAEQIVKRLARWQELEELLSQASQLPECASILTEHDAIKSNRSLLAEPDSVPSLCLQAVDALRSNQQQLRDSFNTALQEALDGLKNHSVWKQLSDERASALLKEHGLVTAPAVPLGSEAEVLTAARKIPISMWGARITSLHGASDAALLDAIKESSPKAVRVTVPGAQINSETELDEYLATLRATVMKHLSDGVPVWFK